MTQFLSKLKRLSFLAAKCDRGKQVNKLLHGPIQRRSHFIGVWMYLFLYLYNCVEQCDHSFKIILFNKCNTRRK